MCCLTSVCPREVFADDSAAHAVTNADATADHAHDEVALEEETNVSSGVTARVYGWLAGYCVLIMIASLCGGWLPSLFQLSHMRMQMMISFVGGLMLGIGFFHMLPHAVVELQSIDRAAGWLMIGLLVMYFLIRSAHFHHHGEEIIPPEEHEGEDAVPDHEPCCDHHHHGHDHHPASHLSWLGILIGMSLHTLIDGLALAASVQSEIIQLQVATAAGFGTFLAILLHKPLDAVSISVLVQAGGWSDKFRNGINVFFALMCPLGATLFVLGVSRFSHHQTEIVGSALAFSAGVFICIALGDLLPELEFHTKHRNLLTVSLVLGVLVAYGIHLVEPPHSHHPEHEAGADHLHFHDETDAEHGEHAPIHAHENH